MSGISDKFKAWRETGGRKREPTAKAEAKPQGWFGFGRYGESGVPELTQWVRAADKKPRVIPKPERRRKGQNALERIAAHYPVRLPRR